MHDILPLTSLALQRAFGKPWTGARLPQRKPVHSVLPFRGVLWLNTMTESWLAPNRRALALALLPASVLAAIGGGLAGGANGLLLRWLGAAVAAIGLTAVIGLLSQLVRPRIGFRDNRVRFNLRAGAAVAVPVEVVEAFFLGQGPAHIPQLGGREPETVNLVARLSQKAPEWAKMDVKPALGHWCEGYVTIRGAWCEPLNNDVIRRLNRRLREAHDSLTIERIQADAKQGVEARA